MKLIKRIFRLPNTFTMNCICQSILNDLDNPDIKWNQSGNIKTVCNGILEQLDNNYTKYTLNFDYNGDFFAINSHKVTIKELPSVKFNFHETGSLISKYNQLYAQMEKVKYADNLRRDALAAKCLFPNCFK